MQHTCRVMFADTTHNTLPKVMLNIYQNLAFSAMKFHAYCKELHLDPITSQHVQPSNLPFIVRDIFESCYAKLKNNHRRASPVLAGVRFEVPERHVHWLGASAFCSVLPRLPMYEPLKVHLKCTILDPIIRKEPTHFKRMLHSTINDKRNEILDEIRYQ